MTRCAVSGRTARIARSVKSGEPPGEIGEAAALSDDPAIAELVEYTKSLKGYAAALSQEIDAALTEMAAIVNEGIRSRRRSTPPTSSPARCARWKSSIFCPTTTTAKAG